MGFWDKVMFWKRKDELEEPPGYGNEFRRGLDDFPETQTGLPPSNIGAPAEMPAEEFGGYGGLEKKPPVAAVQQTSQPTGARETELVLAKLDAIKTSLENINMRLERLERMARGEEEIYR